MGAGGRKLSMGSANPIRPTCPQQEKRGLLGSLPIKPFPAPFPWPGWILQCFRASHQPTQAGGGCPGP